ncbi:MAG: hypothetical protein IJK61_00320, partial [Bacteroidetes bacterium]|nr:hypothetical protein [Bacteroidota bacterium]
MKTNKKKKIDINIDKNNTTQKESQDIDASVTIEPKKFKKSDSIKTKNNKVSKKKDKTSEITDIYNDNIIENKSHDINVNDNINVDTKEIKSTKKNKKDKKSLKENNNITITNKTDNNTVKEKNLDNTKSTNIVIDAEIKDVVPVKKNKKTKKSVTENKDIELVSKTGNNTVENVLADSKSGDNIINKELKEAASVKKSKKTKKSVTAHK